MHIFISQLAISLSPFTNEERALELLKSADPDAHIQLGRLEGICHLSLPRFNQRITLLMPHKSLVQTDSNPDEENDIALQLPQPDFFSTLDLAKLADILLFFYGTDDSHPAISSAGETLLSALFGQGVAQ